jgi:hypothetical protein
VIARSEEEKIIFAQMDAERIQSAIVKYNGNPPPRLIDEKELPEVYQMDLTKMKKDETDDLLSVKPRERKSVRPC